MYLDLFELQSSGTIATAWSCILKYNKSAQASKALSVFTSKAIQKSLIDGETSFTANGEKFYSEKYQQSLLQK